MTSVFSGLRQRRAALVVFALATLALMAGLVAAAAAFLFDPDTVAREIEDRLEAATGREVAIDGGVAFALEPAPRIVLRDVRVANASWGSPTSMIAVRRLVVEPDLRWFLGGDLRIRRLFLAGAELLVETDAAGRSNWDVGRAEGKRRPLPRMEEVRLEESAVVWKPRHDESPTRIALPLLVVHPQGAAGGRYPFEIEIRGGGNDVSGKGIVSMATRPPRIDAEISAERLDLTALFDERPEREPPGDRKEPPRVFGDRVLPFGILTAAEGELRMNAREVDAGKIRLLVLEARAKLEDGMLEVRSFEAKLGKSRVSGEATVDGRDDVAAVSLKLQARELDLRDLWASFEVPDAVDGVAAVDATLDTNGRTPHELASGLRGAVLFATGEGRIRRRYLDRLAPELVPELVPWVEEQEITDVGCSLVHLGVENGRARSRAILLDTARMALTGEALVDLENERVDVSLDPHPKETEVASVALPITVRGPLLDPEASADKAAAVRKIGDAALRSVALPPMMIAKLLGLGIEKDNPCVTGSVDTGPITAIRDGLGL